MRDIKEIDIEIAKLEKEDQPKAKKIVNILRDIHSQVSEIRENTVSIRGGRPL